MKLWQALIMGLIQGLTEFLPVSSSGHLAIAGILFNLDTQTSALFDVLLHVGTLGAVFVVFWRDVKTFFVELVKLIRDFFLWLFRKKPFDMYLGRKLVLMIIVASIPTAILGLIVEKYLADLFLTSLIAVGAAEIITALLLYATKALPEGHKKLKNMSYKDGLFIGVMQGIAVIPGISRSGSTVTAGLFAGLDRDYAFRFSFLVSIPAILGSALFELFDITKADAANFGVYLAGMLVAFMVGLFSIRWLRGLVKNNKLHYFAYYCAAIGMIAIIVGLVR